MGKTKDKTNGKTILAPWRKGIQEAARKTGRSPSHICRVLKGERIPGVELAIALMDLGFKLPKGTGK